MNWQRGELRTAAKKRDRKEERGYNINSGGRRKREVVITILDPFLEITYLSVNEAAKMMSSVAIIH